MLHFRETKSCAGLWPSCAFSAAAPCLVPADSAPNRERQDACAALASCSLSTTPGSGGWLRLRSAGFWLVAPLDLQQVLSELLEPPLWDGGGGILAYANPLFCSFFLNRKGSPRGVAGVSPLWLISIFQVYNTCSGANSLLFLQSISLIAAKDTRSQRWQLILHFYSSRMLPWNRIQAAAGGWDVTQGCGGRSNSRAAQLF